MEIMLACDMCVASEKATFGVPEARPSERPSKQTRPNFVPTPWQVKRSLIPAAGGMFRIPRKIPPAIAIELCLTGDPMDCRTAAAHGLVNHVTAPGGALEVGAHANVVADLTSDSIRRAHWNWRNGSR